MAAAHPAATLGNNGNYYLDTATGNVYLKASGAWSIVYSPAIAALPTTGGTMTGILAFSATPGYGSGDVVEFPNGWSIKDVTSGNFQISASSGSISAINLTYNGSTECDVVVQNGCVNVSQATFGYQVSGVKVVGAQQAHIAHDVLGRCQPGHRQRHPHRARSPRPRRQLRIQNEKFKI